MKKTQFVPTNMIGNSGLINAVFDQVGQVADSATTVLILGESGTGKELIADAIHHNSSRAGNALVKVNCAALPGSLLESELFGHEKGAFTNALERRKGRFELADQGTLFLDEVGEIPQETQIKLLRVLQEKEIERVGGMETIQIDTRIITATNKSLEELVKRGEFREDLYYRLNVFPIQLPALRDRKTDLLQLANHFVERYNKANDRNVKRISTRAIDMMMDYHWPGNVRELENCIERAVLLTNDGVIHGNHLPPTLQTAEYSGTVFNGSLKARLENVEREAITEALKATRGNAAMAAKNLDITERIMGLRMKKYDIDYRRFRE